jgi:hypothetical protein
MYGETVDKCDILLNNSTMRIREHLYCFLAMARRRCHIFPLWIDAICINHKDNVERVYPVQKVGYIYASAIEVLL